MATKTESHPVKQQADQELDNLVANIVGEANAALNNPADRLSLETALQKLDIAFGHNATMVVRAFVTGALEQNTQITVQQTQELVRLTQRATTNPEEKEKLAKQGEALSRGTSKPESGMEETVPANVTMTKQNSTNYVATFNKKDAGWKR